MHVVMFVLDDPGKLDKVLDSWRDAGIRGVTILESTGIQRRDAQRKRIHARFRFATFTPLDVGGEEGNLTLLTIVHNPETIDKIIEATEEVVGNLDEPNTGILAAWPLSHVKGLPLDHEGM